MTAVPPRPAAPDRGAWVCERCGNAPEQHAAGRVAQACIYAPGFDGSLRPAAPDEYTGHRGSCRIFYAEHRCTCGLDFPCVICGYPEREHVGDGEMIHDFRPAAPEPLPDATAGNGLREAIARWFADTAAKPHGMPPYSDLSWAHVRHIWLMEADELLALPALRDVLAAAARDAELREAVTSLAVRFETLSESLFSAASINAYDAAAKCLRRALDGTT